jgi:hypothetical protein
MKGTQKNKNESKFIGLFISFFWPSLSFHHFSHLVHERLWLALPVSFTRISTSLKTFFLIRNPRKKGKKTFHFDAFHS